MSSNLMCNSDNYECHHYGENEISFELWPQVVRQALQTDFCPLQDSAYKLMSLNTSVPPDQGVSFSENYYVCVLWLESARVLCA